MPKTLTSLKIKKLKSQGWKIETASMIIFLQMALILIFSLLAVPAFATPNYEGRWTEKPAWCHNT